MEETTSLHHDSFVPDSFAKVEYKLFSYWEQVCLLFCVLCNVIFFFTEQVQLIEFGGVLDSCGLRSIWDKITSQNTAVSPCSSLHTPATHSSLHTPAPHTPLHTPAPHSFLRQSVFRYTHRTSANASPVRAIVEESNYLPVKERSPLISPAMKGRSYPRTKVHATVAHSPRGRHEM